jgi:hypothetical protein
MYPVSLLPDANLQKRNPKRYSWRGRLAVIQASIGEVSSEPWRNKARVHEATGSYLAWKDEK